MTTDSFQKIKKIGEGTYGVVYKAINNKTGKIVALKKIRPDTENEGIPATTIREILLLKKLKHSTIINLMEIVNCTDKMYLVFEYVDFDLKKLIENQKDKPFNFIIARKMCYQLVTAVAYCHSMGIFHRDIKPQNILVDENFDIKLADFGLGRATIIPLRAFTPDTITLWYRPPELLLGEEYYDPRVDVWSLGCILIEIFTLEPAFSGDSEIDQLNKIFERLGVPTNKTWPKVENLPKYKNIFVQHKNLGFEDLIKNKDLLDLINKMLTLNPLDRITAEEALNHKFFKGLSPIKE